MPKIKQYAPKYKAKQFCKWVEGERVSRKASQEDFAKLIHTTRQTYSKKMNEADLTLEEALRFIEVLMPDDEIRMALTKM